MLGRRFYGGRYFGPRYFGDGGSLSADGSYAGARYFGARYFGPRYFSPESAGVPPNTLVCSPGSYTLTGEAAIADYELSLSAGSYSLTGQAITLTQAAGSATLTCANGSYSLTGQDLAFSATSGPTLVCDAGAYTLTGAAVTLSTDATYFETTFTAYLPLRALSGIWDQSGIGTSGARNLKTWLPPQRQPVAYLQNGSYYMDPTWYRFFEFVSEIKLGGFSAPTVTEVANAVVLTQETSIAAASQVSAVAQQTQANAEALNAAKQVIIENALVGADQIPSVKLSILEN